LLFLSNIVLCEIVWVLGRTYGFDRKEIAATLERIFRTKQFAFENKDVLWRAWRAYVSGRGDFSDYLIGCVARNQGCEITYSFDKKLRNSDLFDVL